jgi:hypothetical protein
LPDSLIDAHRAILWVDDMLLLSPYWYVVHTDKYVPFCDPCPSGGQIFSDRWKTGWPCRMAGATTCANQRPTPLVVGQLKALPLSLPHGNWCSYDSR